MPAISRRLALTTFKPCEDWLFVPLKRVYIFFSFKFVHNLIFFFLFSDNTLLLLQYSKPLWLNNTLLLRSVRFQIYTLNLRVFLNIIIVPFLFRYPIFGNALHFGGIDSNKWMWSDIVCPSIISVFSHLHKSFIISYYNKIMGK